MSDEAMNNSDGETDMDFWLERCSICFDAPLELCLDYCRDQYCRPCFQRYVTEVVIASWGLSVTKIRCPVCQVQIPQSEWSRYVPLSVVEQYNRFNRPYRSFSRCCPKCETKMAPCRRTSKVLHRGGHSIYEAIKNWLGDLSIHDPHRAAVQQIYHILQCQAWRNSTLPETYKNIMITLLNYGQHHGLPNYRDRIQSISLLFLQLEMKPETWKKLQFAHISLFPMIDCSTCHMTFCLQCGFEGHPNQTCEESMEKTVEHGKLSIEVAENLKWKLKHSRRCPNCSIMINREDGCNRMDCSLCGFSFCWECRLPWSEKCGFYHCSVTGNATPIDVSHSKAELGVPNVSVIESLAFTSGGVNV